MQILLSMRVKIVDDDIYMKGLRDWVIGGRVRWSCLEQYHQLKSFEL